MEYLLYFWFNIDFSSCTFYVYGIVLCDVTVDPCNITIIKFSSTAAVIWLNWHIYKRSIMLWGKYEVSKWIHCWVIELDGSTKKCYSCAISPIFEQGKRKNLQSRCRPGSGFGSFPLWHYKCFMNENKGSDEKENVFISFFFFVLSLSLSFRVRWKCMQCCRIHSLFRKRLSTMCY